MRKGSVLTSVIIIIVVIAAGAALFSGRILRNFEFLNDSDIKVQVKEPIEETVEKAAEEIKEAAELGIKEIVTPPPLEMPESEATPTIPLSLAGVLEWTNFHRNQNNLLLLTENWRLNIAAQEKVRDMFAEQYFAHLSPSLGGAARLTELIGYEFISIGENLALGNFEDNQALVQAWMDSPGHRENILNPKFQEIGIAVREGIFRGRPVWLGVQIFGKPLLACPQIDSALKLEIETSQEEINELSSTLEVRLAELENIRPRKGRTYIQKVEEYNQLVTKYNNLLENTKEKISVYNLQVAAFNECVKN